MANEVQVWCVQVYDSQEHSLQTQLFRGEASVKKCVMGVMEQLEDMGGFDIVRATGGDDINPLAFDALDNDPESDRKISVDVFEAWLND